MAMHRAEPARRALGVDPIYAVVHTACGGELLCFEMPAPFDSVRQVVNLAMRELDADRGKAIGSVRGWPVQCPHCGAPLRFDRDAPAGIGRPRLRLDGNTILHE